MRRTSIGRWRGVPFAISIALALVHGSAAAPVEPRLIDAVKKADRAAVDALLRQHVDVKCP